MRKKSKRRETGSHQGKNVFVIAGLPRDTLRWIINMLETDTSLKPARFVGAAAPRHDWGSLYKKNNLAEILTLIECESQALRPHRLMVLYVPSRDADALMAIVDTVCYLAPLSAEGSDLPCDGHAIGWRHDKSVVGNIVYRALQSALKSTDVLKAEITDKRISAFTLPAYNFYYPSDHSPIMNTYRQFARKKFNVAHLKSRLAPVRFTRDNLPNNAFKGQQYADRFFRDSRGRVFPPDAYHAPNRVDENRSLSNELSLHLRQRYRFGVTVRDGNLHYDVQYEYPRRLNGEVMYCAEKGKVAVTGSHANVGVNDVIWTPDGTTERILQ